MSENFTSLLQIYCKEMTCQWRAGLISSASEKNAHPLP